MKYLDVLSKFKYSGSPIDPIPLIVAHSDGVLVSLEKILSKVRNKNQFKFNKAKIADYKEKYIQNSKTGLWIDSGGYNILANHEITENLLESYLACYFDYVSNIQRFDKIFSLDITVAPASKYHDNTWLNTREKIKEWNLYSLAPLLPRLKSSFRLREKFIFVYQFKTPSLYKIWKEIYNELNLKDYIIHRAIGGLVHIHESSRRSKRAGEKTGKALQFSPVIGPAFNCFRDYLDSGKLKENFCLHFLGVSTQIDRFTVIFLEKLFTYYLSLKGENSNACFSIDTSSNAKKVTQDIRDLGIFSFDPCRYTNKIKKDFSIGDMVYFDLNNVYPEHHFEFLLDEIEKIRRGERVSSLSDFFPLNIYSNNNLNRYFSWFIDYNNLLMMLLNAKSKQNIELGILEIFDRFLPKRNKEDNVQLLDLIKTSDAIPEDIINSIQNIKDIDRTINSKADRMTPLYNIFKSPKVDVRSTNLDRKIAFSIGKIFEFHQWYIKGADTNELGNLMLKFIDDIGVEDVLM